MSSKRTPARMTRLVAQWRASGGIEGQLRAAPSPSGVDLLVLVPQAVGRAAGPASDDPPPATFVPVRAGRGLRRARDRDRVERGRAPATSGPARRRIWCAPSWPALRSPWLTLSPAVPHLPRDGRHRPAAIHRWLVGARLVSASPWTRSPAICFSFGIGAATVSKILRVGPIRVLDPLQAARARHLRLADGPAPSSPVRDAQHGPRAPALGRRRGADPPPPLVQTRRVIRPRVSCTAIAARVSWGACLTRPSCRTSPISPPPAR